MTTMTSNVWTQFPLNAGVLRVRCERRESLPELRWDIVSVIYK